VTGGSSVAPGALLVGVPQAVLLAEEPIAGDPGNCDVPCARPQQRLGQHCVQLGLLQVIHPVHVRQTLQLARLRKAYRPYGGSIKTTVTVQCTVQYSTGTVQYSTDSTVQ